MSELYIILNIKKNNSDDQSLRIGTRGQIVRTISYQQHQTKNPYKVHRELCYFVPFEVTIRFLINSIMVYEQKPSVYVVEKLKVR